MMSNLIRAAGSFAIVLVAYWTYAFTAVPLIEPSLDQNHSSSISAEALQRAENRANEQLGELAVLFPPGTLRIESPKILQSDRFKLLIGEYTNEQQGNVRLEPCAIVYLPEAKKGISPEERIRRAIVLEAPQGALLKFNEAFDLGRGKIGQLKSGIFKGPIIIRSAGKTDRPDDDLLVMTRDVNLTEERITTHARVKFRQGAHWGSGRGMHIKLIPGDDVGTDKNNRGPNIAGIESFELAQLERLHLQLPKKGSALGSFTPPATPNNQVTPTSTPTANAGTKSPETMPVDITCEGPFRFHLVKREASFEKRVVVAATRTPGEPPEQLENCDRLTIRFSKRSDAETAPSENLANRRRDKSPELDNLQPSLLVATGNPVVFRAPGKSAEGRARRIEYDAINQDITLRGDVPVYLRQGSREIQARYVRYWSPEPPWQLGRVVAAGPGWIRAQLDDKPNQPNEPKKLFEARWNDELRIRPFEQNQVISLTGGATLLHSTTGKLTSGEIHFYLFELPPIAGSRRVQLQPDRMIATTNVRLESPRVSGNIEELGVWFERDPNGAATQTLAAEPSPLAGNASNPPAHQTGGPSSGFAQSSPTNPNDKQHFHVTARKLNVRVLLRKPKPEVAELTIEDKVTLVETQTNKPNDEPVEVTGEWIHVQYASEPRATLGVQGNPAKFKGRGLALTGPSINVNRGTNRLTVPGAGWMDLPPIQQRDMHGQPTGDSGPIRVHWKEGMEFDGRTAVFKGKVRGVSNLQQLSADTMAATLDRMIQFANMGGIDGRPSPELQELHCEGSGPQNLVWMESRTFKEGLQDAYVFIEAQNLNLNNASGELTAGGPGILRSISLSSGGLGQWSGLAKPSPAAVAKETADPPKKDTLNYLHVRFLGGIRGNVDRHEMTFHDEVRTVFGPVKTWEDTLPEDDPDTWGDEGGLLSTDKLTIREMPSPASDKETTKEIEAVGNTRIEGQEYAAFCTRMCYDQNKGVMLIQGDGRSKATLIRQKRGSSSRDPVRANWFRFWPKTKRMESGGFGASQIHQSTAPRPYAR